jgi:hypothetical protein
MDPEKREEWEFMLDAPLPGHEHRVSQTELDRDAQAFLTAMGKQK